MAIGMAAAAQIPRILASGYWGSLPRVGDLGLQPRLSFRYPPYLRKNHGFQEPGECYLGLTVDEPDVSIAPRVGLPR